MITQYELLKLCHYDPITGLLTWRVNKGRAIAGDEVGCLLKSGYRTVTLRKKGVRNTYQISRLIWLYMTNTWPTEIDHIDRIRDNNVWTNLRDVTRSTNLLNRCTWGGVKEHGISINRGKYSVRITTGINKRKFLGYFNNIKDAIDARERGLLLHSTMEV